MQTARLLKVIITVVILASILITLVKYPRRQFGFGDKPTWHAYDQGVKEDLEVVHGGERNENDTIRNLKNFPWGFYKEDAENPTEISGNCGKFPSLKDIHFNNIYWQKSVFNDVEFYLIGAYLDVRPKKVKIVRILVMASVLNLDIPTRCQLWYQKKGVLTDFTWNTYIWLESWGYQTNSLYQPYLISCAVPEDLESPQSVSLVGASGCETATNNLHVHYNVGKRTKFGVCVKGLIFHDDISIKIAEWIELLNLLGASKLYIYRLNVPENTERLLDYYETKKGLVEVTPTSLPGKYPNSKRLQEAYLHRYLGAKRLVEVVQYTDCFYRNMYNHDYIVVLDIDEVIVPKEGDWSSLLSSMVKSSFHFANNVYFFEDINKPIEDIPLHMHMLQNVYKSKEFTKEDMNVKSFYSTRDVLTVHNHVPLHCISKTGECVGFEIKTDLAQLQHYRKTCVDNISKTECNRMKKNLVLDDRIHRFKEELIRRVNDTIDRLDLLRKKRLFLVALIQIFLRLIQTVENKTKYQNNENNWSEMIMCILEHLCQQNRQTGKSTSFNWICTKENSIYIRGVMDKLFYLCNNVFLHLDIIKGYVYYKYLSLGYIFSCLSPSEKIQPGKELSKLPLYFTILDVNAPISCAEKLLVQTSHIGIIVGGTCPNMTAFLQQFGTYKDFNEQKHWLILGRDSAIIKHFHDVNSNVNSDVTVAISERFGFWDIFEVYNTGYRHGGGLVLNLMGYYDRKKGFVIRERRNKYWRRKNLGNIRIKLATMLSYPHKGKLEDYMTSVEIDKAVDTMNRVGYSIVTQCLNFHNVSWSTILTHSWGHPDRNDTFGGIIGEVQSKRADMGTGLYARPDRITYIDYGTAMCILAHDIMFFGQGHVTPYLIYIRPLEANVWYVLVVLVALIQILLRLIQTVDNKTVRENNENNWSQSIICILGHLCQQRASDVPHLFSGRILIFTLSQFALLLFQLYSASIVPSLLIKPASEIHSLNDLLVSNLEFGSEDLRYVRDLFDTANIPVLKELKSKKLKETHYMPPKEGLSLVNKGGFSYFTELNTGYPIIERTFSNGHVCDLQQLKLIRDARVYTNFQKSSPFRKMMNICIRRLDETSLNNLKTCFKEPYLAASVGMTEFLPLATLLFVGYLNSCLILVGEILWHRFSKNKV